MRDLRHLMVVAVAAVGLALAGCGSDGGPSQADLDAERERTEQQMMMVTQLQNQINALRTQLGLEADDDLGDSIEDLQDEVASLQQQIDDAAEEAADAAEKARLAEMAATAKKLYAGISAQMGAGDGTTFAATDRDAFYNAAGTAIMVSIGDGTTAPTADDLITLMENKDAMVADNHGWEGKMYADPAGGDMVEAAVYSNVEAPKMGRKFGSAAAVTPTGAFEYQLVDGELNETNGLTDANADKVSLTSVTRTAGTETFKLPDPNTGNAQDISVPGSFHGVSGTYICDTGAARDQTCTAVVAAKGFTLEGTGTWTFMPGNADTRVTDAADTAYASYGWWIRKSADGKTFTASVFVDEKGEVADATALNALNGRATYMGGAAGKYALASSTGGTNDAGHFTARATLEANFTTNTDTDTTTNAITGTIDQFIGADGMSRDWSVKLNGSPITDTGGIGAATNGTEWTIGGNAADDSGSWSGNLRNNGTDGVPQVATGTFYSEYGTAGKMVGAFGANKQ